MRSLEMVEKGRGFWGGGLYQLNFYVSDYLDNNGLIIIHFGEQWWMVYRKFVQGSPSLVFLFRSSDD